MKKFRRFWCCCNMSDEDYIRVLPFVADANVNNAKLISAVVSLAMAVLFAISFPSEELHSNRMLYLFGFAASVAMVLVLKYFTKSTRAKFIHCYIYIFVLMMTGILLGTVVDSQNRAVTAIAMLIRIPMLFSDAPCRLCTIILTADVVFLVLVVIFKPTSVWQADITDAIAYGRIGAVASVYNSIMKFERYLFELKAKDAYELDALTGLRNRNSYESSIKTIAASCKKAIVIVYFDVNGLHQVNNTEGHEAGDRMIKTVASQIKNVFGAQNSFRMGGDEFLAVAYDKTDVDIDGMLRQVTNGIARENYKVSSGYAHCYKDGGVIEDSVKEAESFMYANKRKFYENSANDRRRR